MPVWVPLSLWAIPGDELNTPPLSLNSNQPVGAQTLRLNKVCAQLDVIV